MCNNAGHPAITQPKNKAMKSIFGKAMMLVAFAAALLSFSPRFGGEGFEVYLNGKVLLQQFGKDMNTVKNLRIGKLNPQDKLSIRYYHCGQNGTNRTLTIRDEKNNVLKVWRYTNSAASNEMLCRNEDIISLQKTGNALIRLYYSCREVPGERLLANIVTADNPVVAARK